MGYRIIFSVLLFWSLPSGDLYYEEASPGYEQVSPHTGVKLTDVAERVGFVYDLLWLCLLGSTMGWLIFALYGQAEYWKGQRKRMLDGWCGLCCWNWCFCCPYVVCYTQEEADRWDREDKEALEG